jgi:membrane protein required for colicin V production
MVAASMFAGFTAGFARMGIGIAASIAGLLFGFWFYGIPAAWIAPYVKSKLMADMFGFFIVLFAFISLGAMISRILSRFFKWTHLSWLDRLLGVGIGFVRGVLLAVAFVTALMAFTPKPAPNWMVDSKLLPYAVDAAHTCAALTPQPIKEAFAESMSEIRKAWEEQIRRKPHKKQPELKKEEN